MTAPTTKVWDIGENAKLKERLDLYSKDNKEKTILNQPIVYE